MERALHIACLKNLRYFKEGRYQRIYWGAEFCQNLMPNITDTKYIIKFASDNNLNLSIITPFVTEKGLSRLNRFFEFLNVRLKECEVIVNDWGVVELIRGKFGSFKLSLGRLLSRQNRDPAMPNILNKQPTQGIRFKNGNVQIVVHIPPGELYQKGIRSCYLNAISVQRFFMGLNINRIELNNIGQGLNLEGIRLKVSLYTPFVNISTTRFCPMESRFQKAYRINVCRKECQNSYSRLINDAVPKIIYKRGNTTFYKNPVSAKNVDTKSIDRIVFQPELPF